MDRRSRAGSQRRKGGVVGSSGMPGAVVSRPSWWARIVGGLSTRVLALVWSVALRIQLGTWRKEVRGLERFDAAIRAAERGEGPPVLACFWHGKYTPLFALLRGRRAVIFTSRSFRGDVIAGICRHFGYTPVQLADRGREESLERMRRGLGERGDFALCGIAVDGPLGPYHVVKRGVVRLASEVGFELWPVTFAARRSRVDGERWDRFEVPSLFTRVRFEMGDPLPVPTGLWGVGHAEVDVWAGRLGAALEELDRVAEEGLRGRDGVDG